MPGDKFVATEVVWALGVHVYEYGPAPADATTVADPSDEHVADVVVIAIEGETIVTGTFTVSALQA